MCVMYAMCLMCALCLCVYARMIVLYVCIHACMHIICSCRLRRVKNLCVIGIGVGLQKVPVNCMFHIMEEWKQMKTHEPICSVSACQLVVGSPPHLAQISKSGQSTHL